jgi:uncharacterized protein (DUF2342 family)
MVQAKLSDPLIMMGALQSAEQEENRPLLDAHVSAISGYIDYIVDAACARVLGNSSHISEAVRRRRIEFGTDAQLIERLLGVSLSRQRQQAGRSFADGVAERGGADALAQLVQSAGNMPTPNEIDAPGLWLARLEIQ